MKKAVVLVPLLCVLSGCAARSTLTVQERIAVDLSFVAQTNDAIVDTGIQLDEAGLLSDGAVGIIQDSTEQIALRGLDAVAVAQAYNAADEGSDRGLVAFVDVLINVIDDALERLGVEDEGVITAVRALFESMKTSLLLIQNLVTAQDPIGVAA